MIGTTDLPYDGSIEDIVIDDDESDYLLNVGEHRHPRARPDPRRRAVVVLRCAPAAVRRATSPTRRRSAATTRSSCTTGLERGLITIIGGKLTTHRALGEQVAAQDRDARSGMPRRRVADPRRRASRRAGRRPVASSAASSSPAALCPRTAAARLVDVYGTLARRSRCSRSSRPRRSPRSSTRRRGAIAAEVRARRPARRARSRSRTWCCVAWSSP